MSRVVLVHGIGQQVKGPQTLLAEWYPALCDGLTLAGDGVRVARAEVTVAFYGDIFRPPGTRGLDGPLLDSSDVTDAEDERWLRTWWEEAARLESAVDGPEDPGRIRRTPNWVQRALNALSHSVFFVGCSEHMLISSARQVRRYFTEPAVRRAVRSRVTERITSETRVVVAHSLGSVVAYEVLCAHPAAGLRLITVGSPLGIRNLVFDRLEPAPLLGRGRWPPSAASWANIADRGDVVALTKTLSPLFPGNPPSSGRPPSSGQLTDILVDNGARAHDIRPYLTARETGHAIAEALRA